MTSEEIKDKSALDISSSRWLQEIAYQLALANETREAVRVVAQSTQAFHVNPSEKKRK